MATIAESISRCRSVAEYLLTNSDREHLKTKNDIYEYCSIQGIDIKRKSLQTVLSVLSENGLDIQMRKIGRANGYCIEKRMFEMSELRVLIDGVIASHSLSPEESKRLINKLLRMRSVVEAKELKCNVFSSGRVKYYNNEVLHNVECLNHAINQRKKVCFKYLQWNTKKKLVPRYGGASVIVTPLFLVIDDEKYYLVAWSDMRNDYRYYRLDKMASVKMLEENAFWKKEFASLSPATCAEQNFGMFGGKLKSVSMEGPADKVGIIIDRFGTDIWLQETSDQRFSARTTVSVSKEFFGWIDGLEGAIHITGPSEVQKDYKAHVQRLADLVLSS